jgi:hypothetical protein
MARRKLPTIAAHPGEILRTKFMEPMGITAYQVARALHFPGIYEILRQQRGDQRRCRAAAWQALWDDAPILDEPPDRLRPSACSGKRAVSKDQATLARVAACQRRRPQVPPNR